MTNLRNDWTLDDCLVACQALDAWFEAKARAEAPER